MAKRVRDGRGIATVAALGWSVICVQVGMVALVLAFAVARQHQVDGSADLVAISAASAHQHGRDGCRVAARVAAVNAVRLVDCRVIGDDVAVRVEAVVHLPFGLHPDVRGRARAGPG